MGYGLMGYIAMGIGQDNMSTIQIYNQTANERKSVKVDTSIISGLVVYINKYSYYHYGIMAMTVYLLYTITGYTITYVYIDRRHKRAV